MMTMVTMVIFMTIVTMMKMKIGIKTWKISVVEGVNGENENLN